MKSAVEKLQTFFVHCGEDKKLFSREGLTR